MATEKAISFSRDLKDALAVRLSDLTWVESFDSNNDALLTGGAGVAGNPNVVIRIKPVASIQKDILGLAQNVYTPHKIQVAFEGNASTTTSTLPNTANTMKYVAAILGEVLSKGCTTEVWLGPTGTAPTASTFDTAGYNKASFDSLYWPMVSGQ